MRLLFAVLLVLAAAPASADPSLTLSSYRIHSGDAITLQGTGFAPNAKLVSRLFRPDGTEYPEMTFDADARGHLSHAITIVPIMFGTYELRVVEERNGAAASTRFMMVAPDWPRLQSSGATSTPPVFVGVWRGDVQGSASDGEPTPVLVALAGGSTGTVVGTVAYPSRLCGGELWLVGVQEGFVQLGEVITYGTERCTDAGVVMMRMPSGASAGFEWKDAGRRGGPTAASGTVSLRSQWR